jgi:hypothetical protein
MIVWPDQIFNMGGTMTFTVSDTQATQWINNTAADPNIASCFVLPGYQRPCTVSVTATDPASGATRPPRPASSSMS